MIYALGAFDGFHTGHRQLLKAAERRSARLKTSWGVITFDGHPQQLFNKEGFKLLFTPEERDLLIKYFDIPAIEKIPFTRAIADMTPEAFLDFVSRRDQVHGLVVGENFRFGRARTGTPEKLRAMCAERGWTLDIVPSYMLHGIIVSSTAIREAVLRGQLESACEMLGHPFLISGRIAHGDARGRDLGFPTANLSVRTGKVYPARGSYASLVFLDGRWRGAALNIGYNPTFEGVRGLRCEAHVVDYSGDIYDKNLAVFPFARNREEMKFPGPAELKEQLAKDVARVKTLAAEYIEENREMLKKFEPLVFDM